MTAGVALTEGVALSWLLDGAVPVTRDVVCSDLTLDSRQVRPGSAFLACRGRRSHGLQYLDTALRNGARAVLWEPAPGVQTPGVPPEIAAIAVPNLTALAGPIADRFFGSPSAHLRVTGITGTNGKTTCAWLLARALSALQQDCGYIGTLGVGRVGARAAADRVVAGEFTTADAVTVQRQLRDLSVAGAQCVAMEVSSHALDQERVSGVRFRVAAFTNLTRDHLDYHGDMEQYGTAKARLFAWPNLDWRVINIDDEFGMRLTRCTSAAGRLFTTSRSGARLAGADGTLYAERVVLDGQGIDIEVAGSHGRAGLSLPLLGMFNADNALTVAACLLALDVPLAAVCDALRRASAPSGRMETIGGGELPLAIVDYAHTPDALEQALAAARAHCRGALHVVFGCGGDRDRGKRPLMGAVAARLADRLWLTNDNPRSERPEDIVEDIRRGLPRALTPTVELDREAAIRGALAAARAGDVVLIAGKGHEDYQIIGVQRLAFSDQAVARAALGLVS